MSLEAPNGAVGATLTLKQDGDKVTGTYRGPRNEAPATGSVKDNDLKLSVSIDAGGKLKARPTMGRISDAAHS